MLSRPLIRPLHSPPCISLPAMFSLPLPLMFWIFVRHLVCSFWVLHDPVGILHCEPATQAYSVKKFSRLSLKLCTDCWEALALSLGAKIGTGNFAWRFLASTHRDRRRVACRDSALPRKFPQNGGPARSIRSSPLKYGLGIALVKAFRIAKVARVALPNGHSVPLGESQARTNSPEGDPT